MNRRSIQMLAAAVAGLLLLLLLLRSTDRGDTVLSGPLFLPEFKAVANDITNVRVLRSADDGSVTIQRENAKWVIDERANYPADVGHLRELIIALSDARIVAEKTSSPDNYPKLGVGDPEEGGKGAKIVIIGPDFSYAVILGDKAKGGHGYARIAGEATSYLIDDAPDTGQAVGDWIQPEILDIESDRVKTVTIAHSDGETIVIAKNDREQTDFDIADVPEGRELSYATVGNGIAGALDDLELLDVRARIDATATTTIRFETWQGLTVTAEVVLEDEVSWVAFSAAAMPGATVADGEIDGTKAHLSGWQYRLTDYKLNLLTRRWEDLLD